MNKPSRSLQFFIRCLILHAILHSNKEDALFFVYNSWLHSQYESHQVFSLSEGTGAELCFPRRANVGRSRGTVARISMGDNLTDGSNPVNNLSTMSLNAELSRIATTRDH